MLPALVTSELRAQLHSSAYTKNTLLSARLVHAKQGAMDGRIRLASRVRYPNSSQISSPLHTQYSCQKQVKNLHLRHSIFIFQTKLSALCLLWPAWTCLICQE